MIFKFVCLLDVDFLLHKIRLRDIADYAAKRSLITIASLSILFFWVFLAPHILQKKPFAEVAFIDKDSN